MNSFTTRHRFAFSVLLLCAPLLAGANDDGCSQAVPELDGVDSAPAELVSAAAGGIKPGRCRPTGCSGQVCADQTVYTTCEWREEYACYGDYGICERDASGQCGWRQTPELTACLDGGGVLEAAPGGGPGPCVVTGCSGQVCADDDVLTTCEWREEYACYGKHGVCERDASGQCGWRDTPELDACLESASGI
ncbi:hypothetical protein BE21_04010 [Sorangium cellulosum]|uniref:Secreted protein n=1 Tax=Sorangium cellulosum TaxID=56 RepID=A0A150TIN5_SORCE|nr:hypothetical protein BE21_04010 [Sorangium cellulosum]